jgi:2-polyprenyl-3-methyl-5-hydroxy-6-metoxy-1,4-benzoquinol methylase
MTVRSDPENNETQALFGIADFSGKHVLEIGCGDGRMTWRYAHAAAHVTAIDPFEESIQRAQENLPEALSDQVEFHHIAFEDFASSANSGAFEIAILSWTL